MAKKTASKNEEPRDEDYSSEDIETHRPNANEEPLEVDDRAYLLLEYINLEWPAQSIALSDSKLYFGTNPSAGSGDSAELIEINLKDADYSDLKYRDKKISRFINKIRIGEMIYGLSDGHLTAFDSDFREIAEIKDRFGYGLCVTSDRVFAGTADGRLCVYDRSLRPLQSLALHRGSIETIAVENGIIFTGSTDHTIKWTDTNGQEIKSADNGSDVNCLDVYGTKLVYGDDNGRITLLDTRGGEVETISWHSTPISMLRWRDSEVFASGSDEQLCLWDTSLEEEWDYHKYLLFVHQGQRCYKDCCFDENRVISTSQDGICVFTPVSFDTQNIQ